MRTSSDWKVKVIDPLKDPRWDSFVSGQQKSTIYHHSVWKELLHKTFKQIEAVYFILEDDRNCIIGGVPLFIVRSWLTGKRLVSVPFASVCTPLVSRPDDFKILSSTITDTLKEYDCDYLEMRVRDDFEFCDTHIFKKVCNAKSHMLSLDQDIETLRKSFHKTSIQQRIKRAERDGLRARIGMSEDDMNIFYRLLTLQRLKKFGLPPHPYKFFKNMWELLYPRNMLVLHLIEYDSRVIAGMLVLKFNNTSISEHAVANEQYLKHSPYQLLWWKAIETAHREGYKVFDFGKSGTTDNGLIEFKRRWNPEEHDLFHVYFPDIKGVYCSKHESLKFRVMNLAWRHTPLPIAKMGGNFLYRHMG